MNFLADTPRLELFRLGGIPIKVDITFILVPIFLFSVLQRSPGTFAILIAGVFLSVLLHELGHATIARLFEVPVGEILVGGFYGYARMLQAAPSTMANILILFAGPLTNGLIFLACWYALGQPEVGITGNFGPIDPEPWLTNNPWAIYATFMLARINLAMLVFNLLPAFPLDGGRIYRDMLSAAMPRAIAIRAIAALGVIVGLWSAFAGFKSSVVLLLIGAQIAIMNWAILKQPVAAEDR
ncbi:site-2 protease family protein [Hyphomicrobium sp.]|jgi:Zn-dependent protease|uniref:site-2 protease family protein n=1 Tax=Hyphomicrobium sp. TaxID=82 RepID=UPI003565A077